ncbi:MAG TPA: hypothetical protein ENJ54_01035 [Chloroflexi bacterium]|nr:hypothetical protein [Chloroflexota bacterium]
MATATVYEVQQEMPTVALWVPKGVDAHPAMVETLAFVDWVDGKRVLIRGLGVKEQWVRADEIRVLRRSPKVRVVNWLGVVQFPERRG